MKDEFQRWPDDSSDGLWIELPDSKWPAKVADFVPSTFESYVRIFHPLRLRRRELARWAEVATREGTAWHPRIQLPELLRIDDSKWETIRAKGVEVTDRLPDREWSILGSILKRHTASRSFMLGVWEGSAEVVEAKHQMPLELPHRRYYLVEIPFDRWSTNTIIGHYPANLFWPKDRSWFMNIDIDAASSYVGGTAAAIGEILQCPDLESATADLEDQVLLY